MRGSSLHEHRLARGLTQAELAARAGVSRQLVVAVETGVNRPAVDAALGLARALGTTVEELFRDGNEKGAAAGDGRSRDANQAHARSRTSTLK